MSSYLDLLPAHERRKIKERMRSPEEYERLRQRVKGPEDLEREMRENESLADVRFEMGLKKLSLEKLKVSVSEGISKQGIEAMVEGADQLTPDARQALESGHFGVTFESGPGGDQDQVVLHPEGNVSESVKIKQSVSDELTSGLVA